MMNCQISGQIDNILPPKVQVVLKYILMAKGLHFRVQIVFLELGVRVCVGGGWYFPLKLISLVVI